VGFSCNRFAFVHAETELSSKQIKPTCHSRNQCSALIITTQLHECSEGLNNFQLRDIMRSIDYIGLSVYHTQIFEGEISALCFV